MARCFILVPKTVLLASHRCTQLKMFDFGSYKGAIFKHLRSTRRLGNVRWGSDPAHPQFWHNCLPNEEQIEKPKNYILGIPKNPSNFQKNCV